PSHRAPFQPRAAMCRSSTRAPLPSCPVLAQSPEYAHTARDVSIAAGGTDGTPWTAANWLRWCCGGGGVSRCAVACSFRWSFRQAPHRTTEPHQTDDPRTTAWTVIGRLVLRKVQV